ncbi:MAG TPA: bifunctional YncE family protein/alkaline phosphatase family protein [Thermoanaerobaculia bacterium]
MTSAPIFVAALAAVAASAGPQPPSPTPAQRPGLDRGVTLLPNGWSIAPAGRHVGVGDLPLAMVESLDGRYLVVTNNGVEKPTLTVVNLERLSVTSSLPIDDAWLGLAWNPEGDRLYCSGAAANAVFELRWKDGRLTGDETIALGTPFKETFVGGIAVGSDDRLYAVNPLAQTVSSVDLKDRRVVRTVELTAEPYTCLLAPNGKTLFVSLWGGARVLLFDAETLEKQGEVAVGEHPNAMAVSPDGGRLFVACANTNAVWEVDLTAMAPKEQISVALYPAAPYGSTPNALALSRDGRTLLVANADNNSVAVVDVGEPGESRVEGFIPTGWYPTGVAYSRDGRRIFVLSGKGLTPRANPGGPQPGAPAPSQYIGNLLTGSLSVLPVPDADALETYTKTVYRLTPYRDATRMAPARAPKGSPIPARVGAGSPIRYVFYIIRENRTYDQILGDLPRGNGDSRLCLFGEEVTPNAHALAREFVLLDNFYVDAEVSYDGHAFSTGAYATDAIEKMWPQYYGGRGGKYLTGAPGALRNAFGNITAPAAGYIWDACARAGIAMRSYGEFSVSHREPEDRTAGDPPYEGSVPGLRDRVSPDYPPFDLSIPDDRRVDAWLKEFREFEANGRLPRLSIIRLGNDHTAGTRPGYPTPRAMIAENDQALGRLVETISRSRYWKDSAIFVLEDDAQNGPDHVDAHRSVALIASPWARRGAVDSTLYTTSGMLRTIELILGLPPMSQYDAAAKPMYAAFRSKPDPLPFVRRKARVSLDERNDAKAWGAKASLAMDLEEADRAPDRELNEIIWRSVRGEDSPMPPPVRAAFVRPLEVETEGD